MKLKAITFVALLFSAPAFADDHQFTDGEALKLQPDMAYVLVRSLSEHGTMLEGPLRFAPILVRTLSDTELEQAVAALKNHDSAHYGVESNVVQPTATDTYAENGDEEFYLVAVKPGHYVLGGLTERFWGSNTGVDASFCMGTVQFDAKPGVITDLGTILAADDSKPTDIPELKNVVSGRDRGFGIYRNQTVGLRPATASTDIPEQIKSFPIVPADYYAVGMLPNYIGAPIRRLAPVVGVLDYDKDGNVIDLKTASATTGQTPTAGAPSAQSESAAKPEIPDTPSPSPRTHPTSRP